MIKFLQFGAVTQTMLIKLTIYVIMHFLAADCVCLTKIVSQ